MSEVKHNLHSLSIVGKLKSIATVISCHAVLFSSQTQVAVAVALVINNQATFTVECCFAVKHVQYRIGKYS